MPAITSVNVAAGVSCAQDSTTGAVSCAPDPQTSAAVAQPAPDPFPKIVTTGMTGIGILIAIIVAWSVFNLWFGPVYRVWAAHKEGEADLAKARNDQQIQIAEANNRLAAAEANKKAAIVEAEAVAAQITTIGDHVKDHPLYLTWQWIEMMKHRKGATIYVPTEANLPILEAGRLPGTKDKP